MSMTEEHKYKKLSKHGQKIKKLLKKYRSKVPRIKEPRKTPFWVEKENVEPEERYGEYSGCLIKDREYICSQYGLVHGQIFDEGFRGKKEQYSDDYRGIRESPYRKRIALFKDFIEGNTDSHLIPVAYSNLINSPISKRDTIS